MIKLFAFGFVVTTDAFDNTELAPRIPEIWTPLVQEQLFAKTVLANFVTDLSADAEGGGDIMNIANIYTNTFTSNTQSTQGAEVTSEAPAQTNVQLTIDTHKYIAYVLGDKDRQQLVKNFNFSDVYARQAGGTLADDLEDALAALWSGLATTVGDTATAVLDAEVRESIEKLASGNFDIRETAFFLHPYVYWNQVVAIQKFYDQSMFGINNGSFTREGNFGDMDASRGLQGQVYGIPIFTTSNIVSNFQSYRNLFLHRDALGMALQTVGGGKVRVQAENAIRNLGILTVSDIIYGVAELRDLGGVMLNANTGTITA